MKLALQPVRRDLATSYPLSFQSTAASLSSLFARRPLFSITCSLFSENTRGGGTPTNRSFGINNFQPLFSAPVCKAVTPAFNPAISPRLCAGACPDLVGGAIDLLPLCFHILTNCFSRNPFLFTIIRIAPGCGRPPSPLRRGDSSDVGSCVCRKGLRDGARLAKAYFFSTAFTSSMMSTPPAAAIPRMLRSLVRCSRSSGNFIQSSTYMLSSSEHRMTAITPTKTRNVRNMSATAFAAKLRPSYAGLLANTSRKAPAVIPNESELQNCELTTVDCRRFQAAVRAGWARRRRLTTRSRPRTTMVSKSGGATAWPTMATRVALMSRPALTPSASASARSAWSQASWFQPVGGIAASASASLASSSGTLGSFQNLALAAASISNSSEKNARDQVEKSGSRRMRGRNKSTVLENHSRPAPLAHSSFHRPLRFSSAATSGSKSSMGSFCKYCVLNHSSLARSKTALVRLTPSSENFSSKSLVRRNSSSPPALQPSKARKLRNASGKKPSARYMLTSVAPWRLESRDFSGPRISGTCAKTGGSAPSARYSSTCLGVLEM